MRDRLEQETRVIIARELEVQNKEFTRRIFKLMCYCLNKDFKFGRGRCERLMMSITETLEQTKTDEVFWEHLDQAVIDEMGIPLERDYTEKGRPI